MFMTKKIKIKIDNNNKVYGRKLVVKFLSSR